MFLTTNWPALFDSSQSESRSIDVQFLVFNSDLNTLGRVSMKMQVTSAGFVGLETEISAIPYTLYSNSHVQSVLEIIWLLFLIQHLYALQRSIRCTYNVKPK